MVQRRLLLALLLILPACASAQRRPATAVRADTAAERKAAEAAALLVRADTVALRRTLDSLAQGLRGVLGYSVMNLETGEKLSLRGDETFATASLIKVPILVTVFDLVAKGQLSLDDKLIMLGIDKVGGSGILSNLHNGLELTVNDAAYLMITISDNTATNLLLDRILIRRVWRKMESLGLMHSKVHSRSMVRDASVAMDSSVKYGLGVTTPNEMTQLFALMAQGKAVDPKSDSLMIAMLEKTQFTEMLRRFTPGIRTASKYGAVSDARTECALWYLPARVVACVLTKENVDRRWVIDSEPQVTLARMGEAIVAAWRPRPKPAS
jgi:beta-lactamase class A